MDFSEIQPFAIPLVTDVLGYFGGYQSYKQKVKIENINAKRDRLLKIILKVEDFLSVLVEISFLTADIEKKRELIDSLEINQDLFKRESSHISSEFINIQRKVKKGLDLKTKNKYSNQLKILSKRLSKMHQELIISDLTYKQKTTELEHDEEILKNLSDRIIKDDIDSTIYMIDPSGKLDKYLHNLMSICSDQKKQYHSDAKVIELRGKINLLFNKLIDNVA